MSKVAAMIRFSVIRVSILALLLNVVPVGSVSAGDYETGLIAYKEGMHRKAREAWAKAAAAGDKKAQYQLGQLYETGTGVDVDLVEAHLWYSLASTNRLLAAERARHRVETQMSDEQILSAQMLLAEFAPIYGGNDGVDTGDDSRSVVEKAQESTVENAPEAPRVATDSQDVPLSVMSSESVVDAAKNDSERQTDSSSSMEASPVPQTPKPESEKPDNATVLSDTGGSPSIITTTGTSVLEGKGDFSPSALEQPASATRTDESAEIGNTGNTDPNVAAEDAARTRETFAESTPVADPETRDEGEGERMALTDEAPGDQSESVTSNDNVVDTPDSSEGIEVVGKLGDDTTASDSVKYAVAENDANTDDKTAKISDQTSPDVVDVDVNSNGTAAEVAEIEEVKKEVSVAEETPAKQTVDVSAEETRADVVAPEQVSEQKTVVETTPVESDQTEPNGAASTAVTPRPSEETVIDAPEATENTETVAAVTPVVQTQAATPESVIDVESADTGAVSSAEASTEKGINRIQSMLRGLGYLINDEDGTVGPDTRRAIRAFKRDSSLLISESINVRFLEQLYEKHAMLQ